MSYVLDSNIVIHALTSPDTTRAETAKALLEHTLRSTGFMPRQILGEILNLGQKRGKPLLGNARTVVRALEAALRIVDTAGPTLWTASGLAERYKLQFFDAVICAIARDNGAAVLFSEDMHDGLRLGSLAIVNPYKPANAERVAEALGR